MHTMPIELRGSYLRLNHEYEYVNTQVTKGQVGNARTYAHHEEDVQTPN